MSKRRIVIGSRGSRLALTQSEMVKSLLVQQHADLSVDIKIIKTKGDVILDTPLAKIGDKGLFTKEIEDALLNNEIDLAVHSMKDLPTLLPKELKIGAVLKREDPRDAFISHKYRRFIDLPRGAIIATSSLRRGANVLMHRPDLKLVDIRGNVDTRLRKLIKFDYDGMILAVAGLIRLGYQSEISEIISPELMLTAAAQGALGIEIRETDASMSELIAPLNDQDAEICVRAERAFLKRLEGGCQVPIGTLATVQNESIVLKGIVSALNGKPSFRDEIKGEKNEPEHLGEKLAEHLLAVGAQNILNEIYREK
ncbi:MAG TPA: hydroxymethylbilane synthase [bacterium]|nr:hydroxymethylbilane synthase [bacterium]